MINYLKVSFKKHKWKTMLNTLMIKLVGITTDWDNMGYEYHKFNKLINDMFYMNDLKLAMNKNVL